MTEERMMILQMLADHKITAEEAHQLLDVVGEEPPAHQQARSSGSSANE